MYRPMSMKRMMGDTMTAAYGFLYQGKDGLICEGCAADVTDNRVTEGMLVMKICVIAFRI